MRLEKLIGECYDVLAQDIKDTIAAGLKTATAVAYTNDGYIDMCCDRGGEVEVLVYHDDDEREHDSANLEAYLKEWLDKMVDWYGLEEELEEESDEWNEHGFADAADYYRYRF